MSIDTERPLSNAVLKDVNLELKDAGLVAASAAAEVDSTAQILDLGLGRTDAEVVLDVTAVEVESGDEVYTVICEFSNSATFASGIVSGASIQLGDEAAMIGGTDTDNGVGRYKLGFSNVVNDTHYRYMRLYTVVAGTITTGINYSAFVTMR